MLLKNHNLKKYNTFGIDVSTAYFALPCTIEEVKEVIRCGHRLNVPLFVLGGGSNILFTSDFNGMIIKPLLSGIEVVNRSESGISVAAGAGVNWDDLVQWCVERNWGGLENLSHIPGSVGAAPVQNIGAYGAEVKEVVSKVEGIWIDTLEPFLLTGAECAFGYRNSIFKTELKNKVLITKVFFTLTPSPQPDTRYRLIEEELQKHSDRSIQSVRKAIITIRSRKLPDPEIMGNAGSFFKNPIVAESLVYKMMDEYPDIPIYNVDQQGFYKLPAAFLIEKCGWKGKRVGNVEVYRDQPLVLVAYEGATGKEVVQLSKEIQKSVTDKFGVFLEPEVIVL